LNEELVQVYQTRYLRCPKRNVVKKLNNNDFHLLIINSNINFYKYYITYF